MNKPLRIVLGLLISAVSLWFVFRQFDFSVLRRAISDAHYVWFLPAFLVFIVNTIGRTYRWRFLLSPLKDLSFFEVLPKLLIGFFMNNVLPARGGEVVRSVALSKSTGLPISSILGSVVAERLSDLVGLFCVILLASQLLPWDKLPVVPISIAITVGAVAIAVAIPLSRKMSPGGIIQRITAGFLALRSPVKMASVFLLSISIWMGELFIPFFLSRAFHLDLTFLESAGLLTGLSVGVMIPAAPGYVGTYEYFGKTALTLLGKPEALALSFVLVLHFFQLVLIAVASIPALIFFGPNHHDAQ